MKNQKEQILSELPSNIRNNIENYIRSVKVSLYDIFASIKKKIDEDRGGIGLLDRKSDKVKLLSV